MSDYLRDQMLDDHDRAAAEGDLLEQNRIMREILDNLSKEAETFRPYMHRTTINAIKAWRNMREKWGVSPLV